MDGAQRLRFQNNPQTHTCVKSHESRVDNLHTYLQRAIMFTNLYSPLEGQTLLIVDALLLVFILLSEHLHNPGKKPYRRDAIIGLCWSVIVVASAVVQRIP
jgi:hypothetical protein